MKEKLLGILKSRTIWSVIVMFVLNNIAEVRALLPEGVMPYLNMGLAGATLYFRAYPQQSMGVVAGTDLLIKDVEGLTRGDLQSARGLKERTLDPFTDAEISSEAASRATLRGQEPKQRDPLTGRYT